MAEVSGWTDELKAEVVTAYEAEKPTAENSTEIVKELAEQFEKTPNGVRRILMDAEVYIKKAAASAAKSDKPARVSKQDSIDALVAVLEAQGIEDLDDTVFSKLTGKAAIHLKGIVEQLISE